MIPYGLASSLDGMEPKPDPHIQRERTNIENNELKILIVEDELLVAENLKETLQTGGFKSIEIYSSAEELMDNFAAINPDLIIMDVNLEGHQDGVRAAILIHETLRKVPILFLTAYAKEDFPHLSNLDPALYSYLSKPYDPKELSRALQKLLES